jgi:hypothetical protein
MSRWKLLAKKIDDGYCNIGMQVMTKWAVIGVTLDPHIRRNFTACGYTKSTARKRESGSLRVNCRQMFGASTYREMNPYPNNSGFAGAASV